ncbi:CRISPR-associated RAMP protein [candidate division KSB1 bacterium]|nr:CRISPR-associated RAMP protein [candidate division KSB1 bacterium]
MIGFNQLVNRYIFSGELHLLEGIHIGSGYGNAETEACVIQTHNETPYIPGSSLRGALRSTVERIAARLDQFTTCALIDESCNCISVKKKTMETFNKKIEKGENDADLLAWLDSNNQLCDTCKLFGSTAFASKLKVTDLFQKASSPLSHVRFGVGIDRDTETAKENVLFDMQVVERQQVFQFEIIAENLEVNDFALLAIGLLELLNGRIHIGAKSAAGLGKCQLKNPAIQYFDNTTTHKLITYLTTNAYTPVNDPTSFLQQKITSVLEGE